jgi:hypothetical protein
MYDWFKQQELDVRSNDMCCLSRVYTGDMRVTNPAGMLPCIASVLHSLNPMCVLCGSSLGFRRWLGLAILLASDNYHVGILQALCGTTMVCADSAELLMCSRRLRLPARLALFKLGSGCLLLCIIWHIRQWQALHSPFLQAVHLGGC